MEEIEVNNEKGISNRVDDIAERCAAKRMQAQLDLIEAQRQRIAELEAEIARMKSSVVNMLAVLDSLDVYRRYNPVRDDARETLKGEAMKNAAGKTHGIDCPKVQHGLLPQNFSYMHAPDYDGPYKIGINTWCGRCHAWLPEAEEGERDEMAM
jgi:hypothetical protein